MPSDFIYFLDNTHCRGLLQYAGIREKYSYLPEFDLTFFVNTGYTVTKISQMKRGFLKSKLKVKETEYGNN
jgi:hypothetical protein